MQTGSLLKEKLRICPGFSREDGFTLTELIMLIFIAGLFAAVLLPAMSEQGDRENAAVCLNNLKQIGQAVELYKQDNDGWYPANYVTPYGSGATWGWTWREAIWNYVSPETSIPAARNTPEIYNCPSDRGLMQDDVLQCSYNMNSHRYRHGAMDVADGIGRITERGEERLMRIPADINVPAEGTFWTHENWVKDASDTILALDGKTPYWSWRYRETVQGPADLLPPADEEARRPSRTISPQGPKHDGGYNFLFCDGSVRWYELEDTVGTGEYDLSSHRALGMWTKTLGK